jgi:hypothetical protein
MSHIVDRNARFRVDTQPIIHALIASFLALGSAVNEETLQRWK